MLSPPASTMTLIWALTSDTLTFFWSIRVSLVHVALTSVTPCPLYCDCCVRTTAPEDRRDLPGRRGSPSAGGPADGAPAPFAVGRRAPAQPRNRGRGDPLLFARPQRPPTRSHFRHDLHGRRRHHRRTADERATPRRAGASQSPPRALPSRRRARHPRAAADTCRTPRPTRLVPARSAAAIAAFPFDN